MTPGLTMTSGTRHDTGATLRWMAEGTELLLHTVGSLPDQDLDASSALPGWTRRHVVAHLARNAEALERLLVWAETGVENPMYAGPGQRTEEIERSRRYPVPQLRRELLETARSLERHCAQLTVSQWLAPVRTATGREVLAAEVPWLRAREVWLHSIDLDAGVSAHAMPDDFADALITDVIGGLAARSVLALRLTSESSGREWVLGQSPGQFVSGTSRSLAAWLTSRTDGSELDSPALLPPPPAWL